MIMEKVKENSTSECDIPCDVSPASQILDSGDRTEFESGAVRDLKTGNGRCDLMPLSIVGSIISKRNPSKSWVGDILNCISNFMFSKDVTGLYDAVNIAIDNMYDGESVESMLELSVHFKQGAEKYGERNWEIGIPCHSYVDSGVRHLLKFANGQTDEDHKRAFLWNMTCLIWTYINRPDMNDLPNYEYPADERSDTEIIDEETLNY